MDLTIRFKAMQKFKWEKGVPPVKYENDSP
jgi:hypothetical protein